MQEASRCSLNRSAMITKILAIHYGLNVEYWMAGKNRGVAPITDISVQLLADPEVSKMPYDRQELVDHPRKLKSIYAAVLTPGFVFPDGVGTFQYKDIVTQEIKDIAPQFHSNARKCIEDLRDQFGVEDYYLSGISR